MGQIRNQTTNQNMSQNKRKRKHNIPKPMGCSKSRCWSEIYAINACIMKKVQIDNITPQGTRKRRNLAEI